MELEKLAKATCPNCGDTIESKYLGHFVRCSCGKSFVDTVRYGGLVANQANHETEENI